MSVKGTILCRLFEAPTYIKGEALLFVFFFFDAYQKKGAIENLIVEVGYKKGDPQVHRKMRAFVVMPSDIALQSVRKVDLQASP